MRVPSAIRRAWSVQSLARHLGVVLIALLPLTAACDLGLVDEEEDGTSVTEPEQELLLDCDDPSSIPAGSKIHCVTNSSGSTLPATYDEPDLYGTWASSAFCVTYASDGTGHFRFPGGIGGGAGNVSFRWGIILNFDGTRTGVQGGGWYVFHEGNVDAQVALIWYRPSGEGAPFPQWELQSGSCGF